jgi:hypothetical protein
MSFPREDFGKDYVPFVRPTAAVSQRRSIKPTRPRWSVDRHSKESIGSVHYAPASQLDTERFNLKECVVASPSDVFVAD